ncbi:DUF3333 domain-containing protein, partial [Escherichia coli]|nr:DUF3333 domain-containing protein [Escherichia coli]
MTDATDHKPHGASLLEQTSRTRRRNAAEARFRTYGLMAVGAGILALLLLLGSILGNGLGAFQQTFITLNVELTEAKLDKNGNRDIDEMKKVSTFGYTPLIKTAVAAAMTENGIKIEGLSDKDAAALVSKDAPAQLRDFVLANPQVIGETLEFTFLANGRI